jgi:hypothetical protein
MNTTPGWLVTKMTLNKKFISLRLVELQHLSRMFHVVHNQLDAYTNAMPDVLSYVTAALSSTAYIEPTPVSISCTRNCTRNSRQFYYK